MTVSGFRGGFPSGSITQKLDLVLEGRPSLSRAGAGVLLHGLHSPPCVIFHEMYDVNSCLGETDRHTYTTFPCVSFIQLGQKTHKNNGRTSDTFYEIRPHAICNLHCGLCPLGLVLWLQLPIGHRYSMLSLIITRACTDQWQSYQYVLDTNNELLQNLRKCRYVFIIQYACEGSIPVCYLNFLFPEIWSSLLTSICYFIAQFEIYLVWELKFSRLWRSQLWSSEL